MIVAWVAALFTLLYFLPWAIAASRYKSNALAIALINLLLGWTLIGWIVALVMACGSHQIAVVTLTQPGYYPPPPHLPAQPGHREVQQPGSQPAAPQAPPQA